MSNNRLLPPDFNIRLQDAIIRFWSGRLGKSSELQLGGRGSVIGGKNLDGFAELIKSVALYCGFVEESIIVTGKSNLTIPGYFRPTKMWDSIVVYKGRLIAAFELKSQVGPSFGNNFNNRSEESIGSATDFWTAHRENAFISPQLTNSTDIKPPFLGYLMLLEDCPKSINAVKSEQTHFRVFPEFINSSYSKRYQLLIERMISEKLYTSGCLILSDREKGSLTGAYNSPTETLNPRSLFADFAATLLAAKETY